MSRSGYSDGLESWSSIKWRGQVVAATRGFRGQKFFRDLIAALEALPEKILIADKLEVAQCDENGQETGGFECCALGALARHKGITVKGASNYDDDEWDGWGLGETFNIARALALETVYINDEHGDYWQQDTPEQRYNRVLAWAKSQLITDGTR